MTEEFRHASRKASISFDERGFALHERGLRVKIWMD